VYNQELFPNGMPNFSAVVKGRKVYDPRDGAQDPDDESTWVWSDNSALCVADYLTHELGMGIPYSEIDEDALIEAANICDETITKQDSTTEKRYTCNGTITTNERPVDVIDNLLSSMAGTLVYSGGKWIILAGAHRASSLSLAEGDIHGPVQVQTRVSRRENYNGVKGIMVSPEANWSLIDFPPVKNDTYTGWDGGERQWKEVEYPFTISTATAQRLAKIELERGRQQITFTAVFSLKGMKVRAGDTVALSFTRYGWTNKLFEVAEWNFQQYADQNGNPALGVQLSLRETASGVWDWADGEETPYDLAANTTLPNPFVVAAPTSFALQSGSPTVIVQPDGTVVPRLRAYWTAPADIFVTQGGRIEIQYKQSLDSDWLHWNFVSGDQTQDFITDVKVGIGYDVRIRSESIHGVHSAWQTVTNHTVAGDSTAPGVPTGLTAIAGTGKAVQLKWTAVTDVDISEYGIWRNTTNTPGTATKIAEVDSTSYTDVDVALSTTYYYWVTAIDNSENESAKSSGASTATGGSPGSNTTPPATPSAPTLSSSGNYQSSDGNTWAYVVLNVPSNTGAFLRNLYYKLSSSADYQIAGQRDYSSTGGVISSGTWRIDDLLPGASYDFRIIDFNEDAYASGPGTLTGVTTPSDSSAPAAPTGLTAQAGTGKLITLDWSDNTEADFQEYAIYRNTTNSSGSATKIAEARASRFDDADVSLGTTYYYWIKASDRSENWSGFSSVASATTVAVQDSSVDQTAPSAPSAATMTGSGVYNAGDGTVYAYITLSVPARPTGAKYQNILWRRLGASGWTIAAQPDNTSTQTVQIDDLSPGSQYEVATQAFSFSGVGSSVVAASGSPFTAPTKSAGPSAPQNAAIFGPASYNVPAVLVGGVVPFAYVAKWDPPADNDVDYYEVKSTLTNSDGATDYSWWNSGTPGSYKTSERVFVLYNLSPSAGYTRVRAINRSGVAGSWAYCGNGNSVCSLPIGNIATESKSDTTLTGFKLGGGGSTVQQKAEYVDTVVPTLSGGSPSENFNVDLTGRGFSTKPDAGAVSCANDPLIKADYDWDNGSNSSTNAVVRAYRVDGSNIGGGPYRFSVDFKEI
jgi:fibronectin type 3 domain-containing protein